MPQAKLLYLLGAAGDLHMSDLVARLGVVAVHRQRPRRPDRRPGPRDPPRRSRRPPPGGRRADRQGRGLPRPLPRHRRAPDARRCSGGVDDDGLAASAAALAALVPRRRSGVRRDPRPSPHPKGTRMSRLSEFAVAKRSVTLLLAAALFIAGIAAWGNLKQELLPDIELPVITVIAPLPGAGAADVADQVTKPIEQAISGVPRLQALQSTSANSLALVIAQFAFGTDVKEIAGADRAEPPDAANLPPYGRSDRRRAQHQLVAGDHRVDRGHDPRRPERGRPDRPDRDRARPARHRGRRQRRRQRRRGAAGR